MTEKNRSIRKWICVLLAALCLAGMTEFFFSFSYDALVYTKDFPTVSAEAAEGSLTAVNCSWADGRIRSTADDPQLLWMDLNRYVGTLMITNDGMSEPLVPCTVFYAEPGEEFSPEKQISFFLREDKKVTCVQIGKEIAALRLDLGEKAGLEFRSVRFIVNPGLRNLFLFNMKNCSGTRILLYLLGYLFLGLLFIDGRKTLDLLFRYRWWAGFAVILLCTLLELHGSSMGEVAKNLGYEDVSRLFGRSRSIRSDEFVVFTQMALAQVISGFRWFSNLWGYSPSDMMIVYGQPVKSLLTLYRPFSAAYLLLGAEKGLAFYWSSRLVICFLVSLEFGRILTGDHRKLSVAYACMIACSPLVAWWFSINELVEMLIFGQGALVLLDRYLKKPALWKKILLTAGLVLCAGGYILALYPAWMIPLFYVFLACLIAMLLEQRDRIRIEKTDLLIWGCGILVLLLSMLALFHRSGDTIHAVMNTVYPGERVYTGGDWTNVISWFRGWTSWLWGFVDMINPCGVACFISFFPLGLVLSGAILFSDKKKDIWLIVLNAGNLFLMLYNLFAMPAFISKVTLLGNTTFKRMVAAIALINTMILIRSIRLMRDYRKLRILTLCAVPCIAGIACMVCGESLTPALRALVFLFTLGSVWLIMNCHKQEMLRLFTAFVVLLHLAGSSLVNPVEKGLDGICDIPIVREMERMSGEEDGSWVVLNSIILNNLPAVAGAKTVNAVATYPDPAFWTSLGLEKEEEIWNRYAHVEVVLDESVYAELTQVDWITLHVTKEKLRELGVRYLLYGRGMDPGEGTRLLYEDKEFCIWELA